MTRILSRSERERDVTVYTNPANLPAEETEHTNRRGLPSYLIPEAEVIVGRVKLSRYGSGRCDVEVDGVSVTNEDAMTAIFEELQHVALARDVAMRPVEDTEEGVTLEGDTALVDGAPVVSEQAQAPVLPLAKASARLKQEAGK
jgi:hypothetical protein